jgi:hypothetical protein
MYSCVIDTAVHWLLFTNRCVTFVITVRDRCYVKQHSVCYAIVMNASSSNC